VQPFVDDDADPAVAEKVKRRLGHWIDRRIAQHFAPLIALRDDESLAGMARGIAFRLVEALGVLPRAEVAEEVKGLDQESRASLRKHGVRFGQYTVFLPLLLKPAPTRLRLVLWSLKEDFPVFPEAPPPGLVTVPAVPDAPPGYYPRAGYRLAGERAIRIDMLERLADMVRALDARAGFEATPEMLSITGLSLDQIAKLMQGLGYRATEGTRPKRRAAAAAAAPAPDAPGPDAPQPDAPGPETPGPDAPRPETPVPDQPDVPLPEPDAPQPEVPEPDVPQPEVPVPPDPDVVPPRPADVPPPSDPDVPLPGTPEIPFPQPTEIPTRPTMDAAEEAETYYVFVRDHRSRPERPQRPEGRREGKPPPKRKPRQAAGAEAKGPGRDDRKPKDKEKKAPPPRPEKPIDPDNPFAALMALKLGR
jgi:ATP-dependent RNA helicase SUPV3L1/SUV3